MYVITDGTNYLKSMVGGGYRPTMNFALADKWDENKAGITYRNLNKRWKKTYELKEVEAIETSKLGNDKLNNKVDTDRKNTACKHQWDLPDGYSDRINEWLNIIDGELALSDKLAKRKAEINDELTLVELAITDIEHYDESKKLTMPIVSKLHKPKRNLRIKRRALKDELKLVDALMLYQSNRNKKQLKEKADDVRDQRYSARVLLSLFENDDIDNALEQVDKIVSS